MSQLPSSLLSSTTNTRRNHEQLIHNQNNQCYGGGWSSSICALFDDPSRRSNCCALLCCGVLVSDRTAYLLGTTSATSDADTTDHRPNWTERRRINLYIPLILLILIMYFAAQVTTPTADDNDYYEEQNPAAASTMWLVCVLLLLIYTIYLCLRGARRRAQARKNMFHYMKEHQQQDVVNDFNHESIVFGNPTGCCGCYKNDFVEQQELPQQQQEIHFHSSQQQQKKDLSSLIFHVLTNVLCCGSVLKCWCQCCGMCAIGQEDRELQRIYREENKMHLLEMDYITFQKYSEYYPAIKVLQQRKENSLMSHYETVSTLSKGIIWYFILLEILKAIRFAVLDQFNHFLLNLAVISQAITFLYFIYWKWNRFDISLDSIIKYFASGYVIGFFQGVVVELMATLLVLPISMVMLTLEIQEEATKKKLSLQDYIQNNPKTYMMDTISDHWILNSIGLLLYTFIVVALVEELVKYYCYFTLETPEQDPANRKSKTEQGNYITIAMITAALGFACKENLNYVLGMTPNTHDEFFIFVLRCLLPIHPLCAAIQSIGIVQRDVELHPKWQLGRSIFPAILLHATYDFTLLFYGIVFPDNTENVDAKEDQLNIANILPTEGIGFFFMVFGAIYYHYNATKQRARLLEEEREGGRDVIEMNPIT